MIDDPFHAQNRTPPQPHPGEQLFEFLRGNDRFVCELRDNSLRGVEARFFRNEDLLLTRRFATRARAVQWASRGRKAIEKGGA